MNLYTTLKLIRKYRPCEGGYKKFRRSLGKGWTADRKILFAQILDSNGLADTLWALRAVPDSQKEERDRICCRMAVDFAEHVLPIFEEVFPDDDRPRKAIRAARDFAAGKIAIGDVQAAARAARGVGYVADAAGAVYYAAAAADAAGAAYYAAACAADAAGFAYSSAARVAGAAAAAYCTAACAACAAGYASERTWQEGVFRKYLESA